MSATTDGRCKAKHPGTGMRNTSPEAWAALFRDYMASDGPLTDAARGLGIRYSAAIERCRHEKWQSLRDVLHDPRSDWIRTWQRYDAERAHTALERGDSPYLADALARAPAPVPYQPGEFEAEDRERAFQFAARQRAEAEEKRGMLVAAPVVSLRAYRDTLH